jgi:hypothetical protein
MNAVEREFEAAHKELHMCRENFLRSKLALFHAEKRLARIQHRLRRIL